MANTAHQRQVADLRKAGLNPILSGMGGSGATTPPGAMGSMPDANESLMSTARDVKTFAASLRKLEAEADLAENQAKGQDISNTIQGAQVPNKEAEESIKSWMLNAFQQAPGLLGNLWEDVNAKPRKLQPHNGKNYRTWNKPPGWSLKYKHKRYPYTFEEAEESRARRAKRSKYPKRGSLTPYRGPQKD